MTTASARDLYGWASIAPGGSVVAGSTGTFTLVYHVGRYGIDDGGTLKIAVRFASDWGYPQGEDPAAPNYYTVCTSGAGRIRHRFDLKGYIRPYQKCLVIDVAEWALRAGDTITVVYGDRSHGSPGTILQTFREYRFEFKIAVDAFGTGQFVELEEHPALEIVPADAAKLVVIGPTQVELGEGFSVGIKLEDEWGNPAVGYRGTVRIDHGAGFEGLPETYSFTAADEGVRRFEKVTCIQTGTHTLGAADAGGSPGGESHPIRCVERAGEYRPFWGDLHGQSAETVGTNSVVDYFRFARDVALVDFAGHQGNDFQITPDFWRRLGRCAREFCEPGRFVVFPGYEWSATTPAGGDRNVYYLNDGEEIFRTSHWQVEEREDAANDRYPAPELFEELRGREALIVPHIGGRPCNLEFHDPELEPVIEIYSAWGQFEWLLRESIERGYRVGFVCGSDDHKGRPGASYPGSSSFGVYGGLTCVLARELTREGVWEALKARRCYGTTGQRIILDVSGDGHPMGEEYESQGAPTISVDAAGTSDIEEVLVMRGLDCVHRHPQEMPRDQRRVRVAWSGARIMGRDRIARWDGSLTVAGPRITRAEGYAFDSAAEGITEQTEERVAWRSVTSGDEDGVVLTLDGADGELSFESDIASFKMHLGQLSEGPHVETAGGVDLQVKVEHLPLGLQKRECRFEFTDTDAPAGCHPYYVRLSQVDGARAWSSPLYVHVKGAV